MKLSKSSKSNISQINIFLFAFSILLKKKSLSNYILSIISHINQKHLVKVTQKIIYFYKLLDLSDTITLFDLHCMI